jgi:hypothetical protein
MRTFLIFPVFVMFLFVIFAASGSLYYNSTVPANYTITATNASGAGLGYYVLSNGTYVFNSTLPVYLYIHDSGGVLAYSFNWNDINHVVENPPWTVLIYVQNGTSYYVMGTLEWNNYVAQSAVQPFYNYLSTIASTGMETAKVGGSWLLDINSTQISLIALVAMIAIGAGLGIRVFGSGMSETSQEIAFKGLFWTSIWAALSIIALPMFAQILIFGNIFYIGMTLMFMMGFVLSVRGGGVDA